MVDALSKNGALCGALENAINSNVDATAADYLSLVTACAAWATEFDTLNTAPGANASRGFVAYACASGQFRGRNILNLGAATGAPGTVNPNPATAANYATLAAAAVAIYVEALTVLT